MRTKIPIQIIELEENNFHIAIRCSFYDQTSGVWIIDTGASKTVFDKNLETLYHVSGEEEEFHSAGIAEQTIKSAIATLKPLRFGKFRIPALKAALLDLSHINELYQNITNLKICGLIGSDFLLAHNSIIDYKKKILSVGNHFR